MRRTLDALCTQTYPASQFEVRVIADGCVDDTVQMLRHYEAPFALNVAEQPGKGASTARNFGAKEARSKLLLFLDDDVEPQPVLVEEHVLAHHNRSGKQPGVVVAPYRPTFREVGFLQMQLRAWWEGVFEAVSRPGHRFTYKDLLGGNVSVDAGLFANLGGFEEHADLRAHEDYEFGVRLINAGASFTGAPAALARHHELSDLTRAIRRKHQEGIADLFLACRHPDIVETLPFFRPRPIGVRPHTTGLLKRLAFAPPAVRKALIGFLRNTLHLLERIRLRNEWNRTLALLLAYAYWCGVAESATSHQTLTQLIGDLEKHIAAMPTTRPLNIDLRLGVEGAESRLDEERPMAAQVHFGPRQIGLIPAQPGAEPLRGAHLRSILATTLAVPFLEALALEGITNPMFVTELVSQASRDALAESIRRRAPWFGPIKQGKMWFEQYSQWNELEWRRSLQSQKDDLP